MHFFSNDYPQDNDRWVVDASQWRCELSWQGKKKKKGGQPGMWKLGTLSKWKEPRLGSLGGTLTKVCEKRGGKLLKDKPLVDHTFERKKKCGQG